MAIETAKAIAEAYRWQRRLGNTCIEASHCHIVANPALPNVWDANHADDVTARTDAEIDTVFRDMDEHLGHTQWRVVHTDGFTPDAFLARLALNGFKERPVTIQMVLKDQLSDRGPPVELSPVVDDADWAALQRLVAADHAEGRRTGDTRLSPEFTNNVVAGYRLKSESHHFHLVIRNGEPVAYGAYAAGPNGVGMIEDLFTLPIARRQGVATSMIAAFSDRLRSRDCHTIFLGALASERPKHLYARLGFRPLGLARAWVMKKQSAT